MKITTALLIFGLFLFIPSCCENEDILINAPTVNTINAININDSSSTINAEIITDGESSVTEKGICWSTQINPTINDNKKTDISNGTSISINLDGLLPLTTYYVKAYAINKKGIGYGNAITFTTSSSIITLTLQPGIEGKDAHISDLYPDNSSGNDIVEEMFIAAWTNSGINVTFRGLIDFDLSAIPENATIESAYLSLFNDSTASNNNGHHSDVIVYPLTGGDNGAYIQRITTNWNEDNISWNTQPATTTTSQVLLPPSFDSHQNYEDINITALVQDYIDNKSTSFGFMIRQITETKYRGLIFATGENTDSSIHPKLVVKFR